MLSRFEEYLSQFGATTSITDFIYGLIVAVILTFLVQWFYIQFGNSVSNRKRFALIFIPLALATMLIITIVKSSIALSLGLVGALSIVRFRAAIKEPEELTFLFLVIGIGLGAGAGQVEITAIAIILILIILYLIRILSGEPVFKNEDNLYINIYTDVDKIGTINTLLAKSFPYVELKRMDMLDEGMDLSYICKADSVEQLDEVKENLKELSPISKLSIIDQPNLIV